jgi:group II intron reverse transcriptase/maturase
MSEVKGHTCEEGESGEVAGERSVDREPGRILESEERDETRTGSETQSGLPLNEEELLESVISIGNLKRAFAAVRRNRGAAGVDGVTIEEFEKRLDTELRLLRQELQEKTYEPSPVRRVEIPKPDGGMRRLGIPNVRDRVFQQALRQKLEPIFEPSFSASSYGFRPGRNQKQAVLRAQELVREGREWVVDIDLEQCFDRLNHDLIINHLRTKVTDRRVLKLIGKTLRSGVMEGQPREAEVGTPQGSPLSPLLCNIVLDTLDKELERRGVSFCRYADDANAFLRSKEAAERVMGSISRFIEKRLKLKVNQEKSKVAKSKDVKFLSFTIYKEEIVIAKKAMKRAFEKLKEFSRRGSHFPVEEQIERYNKWYRGWSEYFGLTAYPNQLKQVEAHFRRRMRKQLVRNQKRARFLFRRLTQGGASKREAAVVFSNRGPWSLSHARAVHRCWSNEWFRQRGMFTRSDEPNPPAHWTHPAAEWFKFT